VTMCLLVPALFIAAMNYFAVDVIVKNEDGEEQTVKSAPPGLVLALIAYVILLIIYGFVKNQNTRREIMTKLYAERSRERGEEVEPRQLKRFLARHNLDTLRAHSCCSCCYTHDDEIYFCDESTGMVLNDGIEEENETEQDFCTRLWDCLASTMWCCGCWCQCFGCCAVAQEEREVNRLTGNEEQKIDYLTFQPYSEYYPSIQYLVEQEVRSPLKHLRAVSDLSSKLLKNVGAVLLVLLLFALSNIDSNFTWENMIVLLLTLGQAFFIEYLVHWKWNLFDLSFDSVVKYFACGFFLTTPSAVVIELVISTLVSIVVFIIGALLVSSDTKLLDEFSSDPKQAMKELVVNYPIIFILYEFLNAFAVAALTEEMVKYFGYRMVVTPDMRPSRPTPRARTGNSEGVDGYPAKGAKSTGSAVTVAVRSIELHSESSHFRLLVSSHTIFMKRNPQMVSVALGFACCENIMYVFVYSPPSLGVEISTLLARSLFPVHPLCAAIQSIGVCKRDLEGDKKYGIGRIIFPAVLLHGSFDFVLMVAAYFQKVQNIKNGNDDDDGNAVPEDEDASTDLSEQLPPLIAGLVFIIVGYAYYVVQSRAQTLRLIAIDNSGARAENSSLV